MPIRKRFGQNFLQDQHVIDAIIDTIAPSKADRILEIGPGRGALTHRLHHSGCELQVIEIDRDLAAGLRLTYPDLVIIEQDVLKFSFDELSGCDWRVVGNLPYNISTPLLFRLFQHMEKIHDMHFMLQQEVVDRLVASPGSKNYGRLSVMSQYYCHAERLLTVPPEAFFPQPRVTSAIVRLQPSTRAEQADEVLSLENIVRQAFSMRRKTIRNALRKLLPEQDIRQCGIDPGERPENLGLEDFVNLANQVSRR